MARTAAPYLIVYASTGTPMQVTVDDIQEMQQELWLTQEVVKAARKAHLFFHAKPGTGVLEANQDWWKEMELALANLES
jgi:hypothetical protein